MRKPKLETVPPLELKERNVVTQIREYKLITPLFGGGVVAGLCRVLRGSRLRLVRRHWLLSVVLAHHGLSR